MRGKRPAPKKRLEAEVGQIGLGWPKRRPTPILGTVYTTLYCTVVSFADWACVIGFALSLFCLSVSGCDLTGAPVSCLLLSPLPTRKIKGFGTSLFRPAKRTRLRYSHAPPQPQSAKAGEQRNRARKRKSGGFRVQHSKTRPKHNPYTVTESRRDFYRKRDVSCPFGFSISRRAGGKEKREREMPRTQYTVTS